MTIGNEESLVKAENTENARADANSWRTDKIMLGLVFLTASLVMIGVLFLAALGAGLQGMAGGSRHSGGGGSDPLGVWGVLLLCSAPLALVIGLGLLLWAKAKWWIYLIPPAALAGPPILYAILLNIGSTIGDAYRKMQVKPWIEHHKTYVAAVQDSFEKTDVAQLESNVKACQAHFDTLPLPDEYLHNGYLNDEFLQQSKRSDCLVNFSIRGSQLRDLVKQRSWPELDRLLETTGFIATNLDPSLIYNAGNLNRYDYDIFTESYFDEIKVNYKLLQDAIANGKSAPAGDPLPDELLDILVRHRDTPPHFGEAGLQHIFLTALRNRRLDIAMVVSKKTGDSFRWHTYSTDWFRSYAFNTTKYNKKVWIEGEKLLFQSISAWPRDAWDYTTFGYLDGIFNLYTYRHNSKPVDTMCLQIAQRLAATRQDVSSVFHFCNGNKMP